MATRKKPAPKRGASRYQAPAKKPVPGWVWLVCGLVIGGFITFLMNLEPGRDEIKRTTDAPKPKEQPKRSLPAQEQPVKPKYDFYTLLPESEVILPPEASKPEPPKPVTPEEAAKIDTARAEAALNGQVPPPPPLVAKAPVTQFFLQAGSFRKQQEAEKVRAQIILLGQDVRVENVTVRDEDWYRVLVGPFANREQLGQAQKTLSASGYNNLLLQQRQAR
ncbi:MULTISPECIES: SPOR domain-containing protein [Pseudomonadaceae]|uniref:SPOR domain-containing protein n=1 Tax=Pseudomonadaceae TaxID=135621 RepID=UPI00103A90F5|nr:MULTISPECIES: SPOR domain-containing protein [unclassified Pseudomonas]MBA1279779.1 SPOR domain-containing protein [Stutzerimonas stutzeri]MBC8649756.1 SPOR domain-containing protein [Pseudomonas sp. MT4]QXY92105.1 SPOR domain-containing protein [Pseudomonas sp. MTM4]TCD18718.1 SPOR domain-containing protein [Pseudomonas sp. IC_126]